MSFEATQVSEEKSTYFPALRNGDRENFFGPLISDQPVVREISLPRVSLSANDSTRIVVTLQGVNEAPHEVELQLNGSSIGSCLFAGLTLHTQEFVVPASSVLRLQLTSSCSGDFSLLQSIAVHYPRLYGADSDRLRCTLAPSSSALLSAFSSNSIRVWDVTNSRHPREVTPRPGRVAGSVEIDNDFGSARTLFASAGTDSPRGIVLNAASNVRSTPPPEFLLVAPAAFIDLLDPLVERRQQQGLSCQVVDVQDLYDEFTGSLVDHQAIALYCQYCRQNWGGAPKYLLIVGDATYDPRGYLGGSRVCHIGSGNVATRSLESASDLWLSAPGVIADVAVGRFPAQTLFDVEQMVAKTLAYETQVSLNQAVLFADNDDSFPFGDSMRSAEDLLTNVSTTTLDVNQLSANDARLQLLAALNSGASLVSYFGHGGTQSWGAEGFLTNSDVATLSPPSRLPIVVDVCCLTGYFHRVDGDSLAEALLKAPSRGAVAVIASTDMCNPFDQRALTLRFLEEAANNPDRRLGDVFLEALAAPIHSTTRDTTILLGDPTLPFSW